jgi:exosortase C (VPDSG-CTERM-specific)
MPPIIASYRRFFAFVALLAVLFSFTLIDLVHFALSSELFSYIILVPFISGYFVWIQRNNLKSEEKSTLWPAAIPVLAGLGLLIVGILRKDEKLTYQVLAFICILWSGGFALLGVQKMRLFAFSFLFLACMVPIPSDIVAIMESTLQHASAALAHILIKLSGIPVFRSGMNFYLPRLSICVAPECSGIHSTIVLVLTSLVAGKLFIHKAWARWALLIFVIPLGIARNAFRILVLALLCVRIDPSYIHSPIHHRGGPIFFVLSLIPFGFVLYLLSRKSTSIEKYCE